MCQIHLLVHLDLLGNTNKIKRFYYLFFIQKSQFFFILVKMDSRSVSYEKPLHFIRIV